MIHFSGHSYEKCKSLRKFGLKYLSNKASNNINNNTTSKKNKTSRKEFNNIVKSTFP